MKENSPLKKHIQESPKLVELRSKRIRARKRMMILLGSLFFVILGGFIFFAHYPTLQITTVRVSGNQIIGTSEITETVNTILSGNRMYIIPYRNTYFYPKQKIIAGLTESYPRLKDISVYRINKTTVGVAVTERRGYALWCGSVLANANIVLPCYFTDDSGRIISPAPYYSGNVYPRFFGGSLSSIDSNPLGKMFIDETQFKNLLAFQNRMIGFGFQVKAINLVSETENTFLLDLGNQKTAVVRFLTSANYQTLADNLGLALAKKEFADKLKKNRSSLEYFDLRFTNKVYYKFTEATAPVKK
jgi:hypothetical protein